MNYYWSRETRTIVAILIVLLLFLLLFMLSGFIGQELELIPIEIVGCA